MIKKLVQKIYSILGGVLGEADSPTNKVGSTLFKEAYKGDFKLVRAIEPGIDKLSFSISFNVEVGVPLGASQMQINFPSVVVAPADDVSQAYLDTTDQALLNYTLDIILRAASTFIPSIKLSAMTEDDLQQLVNNPMPKPPLVN